MSQTDIKVRLKQAWNEFKQKANEEQIKQVEASYSHKKQSYRRDFSRYPRFVLL